MSTRIHHAAVAAAQVASVQGRELDVMILASTAAVAQVHATLALVEQQRVANLIALAQHAGAGWDEAMPLLYDEAAAALMRFDRSPATPTTGPDDWPAVRTEIREALGL